MLAAAMERKTIPVRLTMTNWFTYDCALKDLLPMHGDAGLEIRNKTAITYTKPMKSTTVTEEEMDDEGKITEVTRPWSNTVDRPLLMENLKNYNEKVKLLARNRANLWVDMVNSVSPEVLLRAQSDRAAYENLQTASDCLGLYNLLFKTVVNTGLNDVSNLRTKFHSLRQTDPVTKIKLPLSDFFREFEGYAAMLENTASKVSDDDKVQQLIYALDDTYENILLPVKVGQTTTTYIRLKESITKADEFLSSTKSTSRKRKAEETTTPNNIGMAVEEKVQRPDKEKRFKPNSYQQVNRNNNNRRPNVHGNQERYRDNKPRVCHNCDTEGHYSRHCKAPKSTCSNCGKMGHLGKHCRANKEKSDVQATPQQPTIEENHARVAVSYNAWGDSDDEHEVRMAMEDTSTSDLILIDSGATIHVFTDISYVAPFTSDIEETDKSVKIIGIAGSLEVTARGTIPNIGKFFIVPEARSNLLSISQITSTGKWQVSFTENGCKIRSTDPLIPPLTLRGTGSKAIYLLRGQFNQMARLPRLVFMATHEDEYGMIAGDTAEMHQPAMESTPPSKDQVKRAREVIKLHNHLGHPSNKVLKNALSNGLILGTHLTAHDVDLMKRIFGKCIHCIAGKATVPSYTDSKSQPATKVGSLVHVDIMSFPITTIGNNNNFLLALDEFSGYLLMIPMKNKNQKSLEKALDKLISHFRKYLHQIREIECDSESVLIACSTFLGNNFIKMSNTPPYQHAQRIERYVRTITERARTVLDTLHYDLPLKLYGELIHAVISNLNSVPNSTHGTETPRSLVEKRKLDLNERPDIEFGQLAMFHITGKQQSSKLNPRAEIGVALGPADSTYKAVRAYIFKSKRIVVRNRFTKIDKLPINFKWNTKNYLSAAQNGIVDALMKPVHITDDSQNPQGEVDSSHEDELDDGISEGVLDGIADGTADERSEGDDEIRDESENETNNYNPETNSEVSVEEVEEEEEQLPDPTIRSTRVRIRRRKGNWKDGPARLRDRQLEAAFQISIKEALKGEYKEQSVNAIKDEVQNMLDYQVGHYVRWEEIEPEYRNEIMNAFMFIKHKHKPTGEYERTKARLVADGKRQSSNLYEDISSSMVNITTVFALLSLATALRAKKRTYDIKGAFLNCSTEGKSKRKLYVKIRKEVADIWIMMDQSATPFLTPQGDLILCLDKFLYGLKQSPLIFQRVLHEFLESLGYQRCVNDDCLFVKRVGDNFSWVCTHVDDLLQISNSDELIEELKNKLIERFVDITCNEIADSYLGMSLKHSSDDSRIDLSQKGFIEKILEKYLIDKTATRETPAGNFLFEIKNDVTPLSDRDKKIYLGAIMSLMYLARLTRPDILLPVTYLASRAHLATTDDLNKLQRVLMYLNGTKERGLVIQSEGLEMKCCCDASYGVHHDGKSHTGYMIKLGGSLINTRSIKQKTTAISSTDAEIIALADATKNIVWITHLLKELVPYSGTTEVSQDNKSCILLTAENTKAKRSKHLLTKISFIREHIVGGMIHIVQKGTEEMTSDSLTKPLQGEKFENHTLDIVTDLNKGKSKKGEKRKTVHWKES